MHVREARLDEHTAVMSVLDAAMLETGDVRERIPEGVLVAVEGDRLLGVLVLADEEIDAVAVRPGRRRQGIGTALVDAAADRCARIIATFDADLRPFYREFGFEVEPIEGKRFQGVYRE